MFSCSQKSSLPEPSVGEEDFPVGLREADPSIKGMENRARVALTSPFELVSDEAQFRNGSIELNRENVRTYVEQRKSDPVLYSRQGPPPNRGSQRGMRAMHPGNFDVSRQATSGSYQLQTGYFSSDDFEWQHGSRDWHTDDMLPPRRFNQLNHHMEPYQHQQQQQQIQPSYIPPHIGPHITPPPVTHYNRRDSPYHSHRGRYHTPYGEARYNRSYRQ